MKAEKEYLVEISPIFRTNELKDIFYEITEEVFTKYADLLDEIKFLMTPTNADTKNSYDGTITKIVPMKVKTGTISICEHEFERFDTKFQWIHFTHNNLEKYESYTFKRIRERGLTPTNSWYYSYMKPGATFPKHIDGKKSKLRYLHSVIQYPSDVSFEYGNNSYFFPEHSSYIFNGEIPHIVVNNTVQDRLVYVGTVADLGKMNIIKTWANG